MPPTWRIGHASQQGTRNKSRSQQCQDHSCYASLPQIHPDTFVAAVADGVGSATHSRIGARAAVDAAVTEAIAQLWLRQDNLTPNRLEAVLNASVNQARVNLEKVSDQQQIPLRQLSTTLLIAIHTRGTIATAQVGDGAAIISDNLGEFHTFAKPTRGEYDNQTSSITDRRFLQSCQINVANAQPPITGIALTTDGLLKLSLANNTFDPHKPFFEPLFTWLVQHPGKPHWNAGIQEFLASSKVQHRTDDDTTLLLAARIPPQ